MRNQHGFTLIDLMIVMAIISIIMAIAIPTYQNYIVRSQVLSALADISPGRTLFESHLLANGITASDVADIGLVASSAHCNTISLTPGETGHIECVMAGPPIIRGESIRIERSLEGFWSCTLSTAVPPAHRPAHCDTH